jgi:hypothetical protein
MNFTYAKYPIVKDLAEDRTMPRKSERKSPGRHSHR